MKEIATIESDEGILIVTGSAIKDGVDHLVDLLRHGTEAVSAHSMIADPVKPNEEAARSMVGAAWPALPFSYPSGW